jgi:hypothetical protein
MDGARKLQLWWTEHDGPAVEKPSRKGFGSSLIQRLLTMQCKAEIEFAYDRPGLRFQMSVPLVGAGLDEMSALKAGEPSSVSRHQRTGGTSQLWPGGTSSKSEPEQRAIRPRLS